MFGVVPKALWSKTDPSDDDNRIHLALRVLLVLFEDRKILVDVGIGHKFPPKYQDYYRLDYSRYSLKASLAQHQVHPGEQMRNPNPRPVVEDTVTAMPGGQGPRRHEHVST